MRGGSGRTKRGFPSAAHGSAVGKPSKKDSQPCKGVPNAPSRLDFWDVSGDRRSHSSRQPDQNQQTKLGFSLVDSFQRAHKIGG